MPVQQPVIPQSSFLFLQRLKKNNNRDWFNARKEKFLEEQQQIELFAESLLAEMNKHDVLETATGKKSLHRIYRDTRFSKEKIPYKTNWSGGFKRATKLRRGGYYFQLEPGNSFVAGGFWGPETADLKRIRDDIGFDPNPLRKILSNKSFKATFGELRGEQLKSVPRGFDPHHEAIDLLRYKQFLLIKTFSDDEVFGTDFLKNANQTFKAMRPFLDYMSDVLSTDINGVTL